ncbi:MAG: hypothetical protein HY722_06120 [Planctomycetes bacterium]|nr:hypothetical protein [Planctomycetota bacterium]
MRGIAGAAAFSVLAMALACRAVAPGPPRPAPAHGEVLYRNAARGGDTLVVLATDPASPHLELVRLSLARSGMRLDRGAGAGAGAAVGGLVAPEDLGGLVARLDEVGLYALPALEPAPDLPPREVHGVVVDAGGRRFAVVQTSFTTADEFRRFALIQKLIIAWSNRAVPPPDRGPVR